MDTTTIVKTKRYREAWGGLLSLKDGPYIPSPKHWTERVEECQRGELIVLTDVPRMSDVFGGCPRFYPTHPVVEQVPVAAHLGAWFDGEQFTHPHWYILDWGAWPGGQGPRVPGGATLLNPPVWKGPVHLLDAHKDELKSASYRGLVSVGLTFDDVGKEFRAVSFQAGWHFLHTHLFVYSLAPGEFSLLLMGQPIAGLEKQFTVGVPVSIPPWPLHMQEPDANVKPATTPIVTASSEVRQHVMFHDMQVVDGKQRTAGLDGLVGVALGNANSLALARTGALGAAALIGVPQRQFRPDVGGLVDQTLGGLEQLGLW
jgi:hypothetical protein